MNEQVEMDDNSLGCHDYAGSPGRLSVATVRCACLQTISPSRHLVPLQAFRPSLTLLIGTDLRSSTPPL